MPSERLNTFYDASGLVTVAVFRSVSPSPQQHQTDLAAYVAEDMVVIGGGGVAAEFPEGALLTASYPNDNLTAWLVSSKDHEVPNPHTLTAYAIGLKIQGMTRQQLLDAIHINVADSGLGQHPEASATMPSDFLLVSGGFKVEWSGEGNLGTASFPSNSFSWTAKSKDHLKRSPANLRAYAIGLREHLPVGRVQVSINTQESTVSNHPAASADLTDGFALTGGGAEVHWHGQGNLLWRLQPVITTSDQEFLTSSKDHVKPDPSTITAYALGIRILR